MLSLPLKLLAATVALAVVAATAPADAAARKAKKKTAAAAQSSVTAPARYRDKSAFPKGPVYFGKEYLGDDPDPFIRFQLLRDIGAHFGGED